MAEGRKCRRLGSCAMQPKAPARRGDLALPIERYLHQVLDEWFENEVKPRLNHVG